MQYLLTQEELNALKLAKGERFEKFRHAFAEEIKSAPTEKSWGLAYNEPLIRLSHIIRAMNNAFEKAGA